MQKPHHRTWLVFGAIALGLNTGFTQQQNANRSVAVDTLPANEEVEGTVPDEQRLRNGVAQLSYTVAMERKEVDRLIRGLRHLGKQDPTKDASPFTLRLKSLVPKLFYDELKLKRKELELIKLQSKKLEDEISVLERDSDEIIARQLKESLDANQNAKPKADERNNEPKSR